MKHIAKLCLTGFNIKNFEPKLKTSKLTQAAIAAAKDKFQADIAVYRLEFYG